MSLRVVIATVGLGQGYARGVARMITEFGRHGMRDIKICAWTNGALPLGIPPAGVPRRVQDVSGWDYTGYCAKPFALREAAQEADIAILLDASYLPVKNIDPLIHYIKTNQYYMAMTGFSIGQWASEDTLKAFHLTREDALKMPEWASGCVGMNMNDDRCRALVAHWPDNWRLFPGPHYNTMAGDQAWLRKQGRNVGWVSDDPRVLGHRHDQTILSLLAHEKGFVNFDPPHFAAYDSGKRWPETVLVCRGGL